MIDSLAYYVCSTPQRIKILNLLGEFHKTSCLHLTDFAERNVVVREGRYRLIDFSDFEHHTCEWFKGIDWRKGEFWLTAKKSIPCWILGELGDEMGLWNDCERQSVFYISIQLTICSLQTKILS